MPLVEDGEAGWGIRQMTQAKYALRFRKSQARTLSNLATRVQVKYLQGFLIAAAAAKAGQPMGVPSTTRDHAASIASTYERAGVVRPIVLEARVGGWMEVEANG